MWLSPFCFSASHELAMVFNPSIQYKAGRLKIDDVDIESLVNEIGTPLYIYSLKRLTANYQRVRDAFAPSERAAPFQRQSEWQFRCLARAEARRRRL